MEEIWTQVLMLALQALLATEPKALAPTFLHFCTALVPCWSQRVTDSSPHIWRLLVSFELPAAGSMAYFDFHMGI